MYGAQDNWENVKLVGVRPLLTIFTDIGLGAPLSLGMHNPTTASSAVGLDYIVLFVEEFS